MNTHWHLNQTVFRIAPGSHIRNSLSCGFMDKSGCVEDTTRESYDRLVMIYILRGQGRYEDDHGITAELRAGDVFFRYPDRVHSTILAPESQWQECFVSVRSEWHSLLFTMGLIPTDRVSFQLGENEDLPQQILRLMQNLEANDTPLSNARMEFSIVTLMQQTLAYAQEQAQAILPRNRLVEKAREAIRKRAQEQIDMETLLAPIGISYSRLRTLFRQTYGTSPGEYRIRVRIERACSLLETTDISVKEIAEHLGYADAFSFSKQFKQHTQQAPKHFRLRVGRKYMMPSQS